MNELERLLAERISAEGPLSFSDYVAEALYHPHLGFYATGGRAGRRGDFLTSPEVGPLFGAVVARALDTCWTELGRPAPFVFVDAGAGPGTLARSIDRARPECLDSLHYMAVEISRTQRDLHPDWVDSRGEFPTDPFVGVVLANELLDNLPFDLVDADGVPVLVSHDGSHLVAHHDSPGVTPVLVGAHRWLLDVFEVVTAGRVVVIDYTYQRNRESWLRTYRGHRAGTDPLDDPGEQDITVDLPVEQLTAVRPIDRIATQARWLIEHGIEELVEEGRRVWHERAHLGDLEALASRSRVAEAEALLAADGLGSFSVLEWSVSPP